MLRVSTVDGRLNRPRGTEPARPDLRAQGTCVPDPRVQKHGVPHYHADRETAVYMVSGEADVWHGPDLAQRSAVRAGDFIYIPSGTPHLAVNRGDVNSIAVVACADPADQPGAVVIELPRHLVGLSSYPVG